MKREDKIKECLKQIKYHEEQIIHHIEELDNNKSELKAWRKTLDICQKG